MRQTNSSRSFSLGAAPPVFRQTFRAEAADIDEMGHVNNAVYVRWLQEIAGAHWLSVAEPEELKLWAWVIVRHEIDYRRAVLPGEAVEAETWAGELRGARFNRHVRMVGADGSVRAEAVTTWALLERASGRLARVPRELAVRFTGSL